MVDACRCVAWRRSAGHHFAARLAFDGREMELVREQLDQLMRFDPRRTATTRRERLLVKHGRKPPEPPVDSTHPADPASAPEFSQPFRDRISQDTHALGSAAESLLAVQADINRVQADDILREMWRMSSAVDPGGCRFQFA